MLSPLAHAAPRAPMTMDHQVFVGYQGWFMPHRAEDDARWFHYGNQGEFKPGSVAVEMWPDTSELDPDEKVPTDFRNPDGSVATVFDSQNPKTVDRHFRWMHQYGIDGAFLQRFVGCAADPNQRPSLDRVLSNVRSAAAKNQVSWSLMYDLSGVKAADVFPFVSQDWKRLAGELKIRDDAQYIHHRSKPVVVLWGIGFNEPGRPTPADFLPLIKFLKDDPVYGGNTVILGVPFYWRSGTGDAIANAELLPVLRAADVIAPWPVGRYDTVEAAKHVAETERLPDIQWTDAHGLDYLPAAFPGFSWHNLMATRGQDAALDAIPRQGGQFLWTQAVTAKRAGAKMLYLAMFDEIDEGTALFKVSNTPPPGETKFLTYQGLSNDHYLKLAGQIARMFRGELPATVGPPP